MEFTARIIALIALVCYITMWATLAYTHAGTVLPNASTFHIYEYTLHVCCVITIPGILGYYIGSE